MLFRSLTAAQAAIPVDVIGIWVLAGESIEEWLKIKGFCGLVGFIMVGGGPLFLCFLMPLIGWRLGQNCIITQTDREFSCLHMSKTVKT